LQGSANDPVFSCVLGLSKTKKETRSGYQTPSTAQEFVESSDVIIDFSSPEALEELFSLALKMKTPLVIGTTGLTSDLQKLMRGAAEHIPIAYSANFSLGVAACLQAVEMLSQKLHTFFDISIVETHHVHKKDSPSGTALAFAKATGTNPQIESLRQGEVIGRHEIAFANSQEKITLSHEALSRDTFAQGALFAAKSLVSKPPGLYSIKDLLESEPCK
jgi:4-hydroxy-tetrahydrodipicolinate reductase